MRSVLLFCLLFVGGSCFAQIAFKGGLSIGTLTSQVDGDGQEGFNKIAMSGGAFLDLEWSEKITTRMEINYTPKGGRNKPNTEDDEFETFKLSLNYVEIPLTLRYALDEGFSVDGGIYYGILLSSSQENDGVEYPITPAYNNADIGGHLGTTYFFTDHVAASIRYSLSILPMRSAPDAAQGTLGWDGGGYNRCISLLINYRF
jgi:hypothetical protein